MKELRILEVKNGKLIGDKSMGVLPKENDDLVVGGHQASAAEITKDATEESVDEVEENFENFDYGVNLTQVRLEHDVRGEVIVKFTGDLGTGKIGVFGYKIKDFQEGFSANSPLFEIDFEKEKDMTIEEVKQVVADYIVDFAEECDI